MSNVLIISDTHCPGMRHDFVDFLLHIADSWNCDQFVHIGDLVDWESISYHEKNPQLPGPQAEYDAAFEQVQSLYRAFPKVHWLRGNHDDLPARKMASAGLPTSQLLKPLPDIWQIPGWTIYPRFHELLIDGVIYSHGDAGAGGQFPHLRQASDAFQSKVIGHFHSIAGIEYLANRFARIFGMAVGCGCDSDLEQFKYGKKYRRKPINACGVVLNGEIPILEPMLLGQ